MSRSLAFVFVCGVLFWCGCTSDTQTPTSNTDEPNAETVDADTVVDTPAVVPASVVDSTETAIAAVEAPDSPQAFLEKMQAELKGAVDQRAGVKAAVATSVEARAAFPDDENILRHSTVLIYQSLRTIDDKETLISRRLELGKLSRLLLERNKGDLDAIGNLPSILLIEEAKGFIASNDLPQASKSIEEARTHGFNQTMLFYFDPAFQPMLDNEEYATTFQGWMSDEIDTKMAEFESFPFEFKLKSLTSDGEEEVSLADFKGKPVIVDFWGTWCPPCRAALPHLVELHEKHKGELVVLGINFEQRTGAETFEEAKEVVAGFLKTEPLPYPCLYAEGERELTAKVPGFGGFPAMVFIGKDGTVQLSLTGYNPAPVLEVIVDRLLAM